MSDYMQAASTALADALRGKKDSAALGPMRYRQDGRGRMVPDDEGAAADAAQKLLSKILRVPEKSETPTDRALRAMGQ